MNHNQHESPQTPTANQAIRNNTRGSSLNHTHNHPWLVSPSLYRALHSLLQATLYALSVAFIDKLQMKERSGNTYAGLNEPYAPVFVIFERRARSSVFLV